MKVEQATWVMPYYRNMGMLAFHAGQWATYPDDIKERLSIIIVDDGSPEPARLVLKNLKIGMAISLFRITEDIGWNCGGAKNLGMTHVQTDWALLTDIDHAVRADTWHWIFEEADVDPDWPHHFPRVWPDGRPVREHADSMLIRKETYWSVGGYDEDYAFKMGGSHFIKAFERRHERNILPAPPILCCCGLLPDSTSPVTQDEKDAGRLRRQEVHAMKRQGELPAGGERPLRFPWKEEKLCTEWVGVSRG